MNALPQRFFSCSVCGGASPSTPANPAANCGAVICNDAYYSLAAAARLKILGTGVGSNCQVRFTSARGFVFDDGTDAGQFITTTPQVTMPAVNGGTVGAWTSSASWPVLVGAVGTDPHTWRFIYAPTTGSYRVESENGNFKLVDASTIPGVGNVANQGTTVRDVRPFGFWAPDETLGSPAWELRRLGIYHKGVIVGLIDADTNPQMRCLDPANDVFEYPGTIRGVKVQWQTFEQVDNTGTPIAGGFDLLDPTAITDGIPLYYSPSQKKLYRSPANTREFISNDSNVAVTLNTGYQQFAGHLAFATHAIKFKNVKIDAEATFSTQEQFLAGLFRNNLLIHTWNFDVSAQPNNSFSFTFLDVNAPIGNVTYDIRFKVASGTNAATMFYSAGSLFTLPD